MTDSPKPKRHQHCIWKNGCWIQACKPDCPEMQSIKPDTEPDPETERIAGLSDQEICDECREALDKFGTDKA